MRRSRVRKFKRWFRRFWREWGISWEEFEMLLGALSVVAFPFALRILLAFFGI